MRYLTGYMWEPYIDSAPNNPHSRIVLSVISGVKRRLGGFHVIQLKDIIIP